MRNFHEIFILLTKYYQWGDKTKQDAMTTECTKQGGKENAYRVSFLYFFKNLTSRDYSEEVCTNKMIILKWIVMKNDRRGGVGLIRPITGLALV